MQKIAFIRNNCRLVWVLGCLGRKAWPALLFLLLPVISMPGQIPVGTWRDHLPYNQARRLAEAGNKIYCTTFGGGLFSFNTKDNSVQKYSKANGLSDAEISAIGYSHDRSVLVIGYSNGNIDLIKNDSIINVPDIKRKTIVGDKSLYNFFFRDDYAYIASGFGIVVLNLVKHEIKDSYFFGSGGGQIRVNDITSDGQYLYAATAQGIYIADIDNPNLVDYNAWEKLASLPDPDHSYRFLAWYDNRLFTIYRNTSTGYDNIIAIGTGGWELWQNSQDDHYDYFGEQGGNLVICGEHTTRVFNAEGQQTREIGSYYAKHALVDSKNGLWYADPESGLIRVDESGAGTVICPNGPAFRTAGDMAAGSGKVWVGAGTDETKWTSYGAYSFIDEQWKSYNNKTIPALEGFLNISRIAIDPLDETHIMGGSYGWGVAEFKDGNLVGITDERNSVLRPVTGYGHEYVLVTGMNFDPEGNLWLSTTFSDNPVYRRSNAGEWESVKLNYKGFGIETRVGDILPTSSGQIWLLIQNDGILVFSADRGNSSKERFFTVENQVPDLLDRVFSLAEDKEGNIWVGTSKGPVVYFDPSGIFDLEKVSGYQPEIPRNDGTLFVDLLLSTEKINAIAVDGANQKWLATEKSGVFLVSPDGKKELQHFTEENSPLFSNNVQTLTVNDQTGEVFFGTDKGIVSFRGQATEGGNDFGHVYVFPNPVRENYVGDITVTGLARNVNVKITDISGNLVFETTSLGGQAIWDGKNFRGERVHTGVYLVFCTNDDGSKTRVTKILLIH
jgi:ligand-binding sensor domain-containing protein